MDCKIKIPDIIAYLFVGGIAALTDLVIFFIFAKQLGFNYIIISIVGFLIATLVNYLLSIKIVFNSGSRFAKSKEIVIIYLVSSIALVVHISVLHILIHSVNCEKMLSKIAAIISAFIFNFLLRKYFVFKKKSDF
ncbi:GtrA family protein [bacterium]|nr:GtrA family protein [bacterium]